MIGAGIAKDMQTLEEGNQRSLRRIGQRYHHFDTTRISEEIISHKKPIYPPADPVYLQLLRLRLEQEESNLRAFRLMTFGFALCIILALAYALIHLL